eukprot:1907901-Alexandrium_andersonii.AAC.1
MHSFSPLRGPGGGDGRARAPQTAGSPGNWRTLQQAQGRVHRDMPSTGGFDQWGGTVTGCRRRTPKDFSRDGTLSARRTTWTPPR